jgi:hypothetical protein
MLTAETIGQFGILLLIGGLQLVDFLGWAT